MGRHHQGVCGQVSQGKGGSHPARILYERKSDSEKAIKEYNIALSLDPDQAAGLNNLGLIYIKRKEFTKGWSSCDG